MSKSLYFNLLLKGFFFFLIEYNLLLMQSHIITPYMQGVVRSNLQVSSCNAPIPQRVYRIYISLNNIYINICQ
jgi:hypothetical protein